MRIIFSKIRCEGLKSCLWERSFINNLKGITTSTLNRLRFGTYIAILSLWLAPNVLAQKKLTIYIVENGDTVFSEAAGNTSEFNRIKAQWLSRQWAEGYLEYEFLSADTLKPNGEEAGIAIHCLRGKVWKWGEIRTDSLPSFLKNTGLKSGTLINPSSIESLHENILTRCENLGYPFAQTSLNNIRFREGAISASLSVEPGPLILYDSLIVVSEREFPLRYLRQYLNLQNGEPYSEENIRRISARIREIPFLDEERKPSILFVKNKARVYLYLKDRKASFVNGIAGLQPDPDGEGSVITGQLDLKLLNVLRGGEIIEIGWKRIQVQTQDLKIEAQYPYLFGTPAGIEGRIKIFRRDSSFNSVTLRFGLSYLLPGGNRIKLFTEKNQNTSLSGTFNPLGNIGNSESTTYGLGVDYRKIDNWLNPLSGYWLQAEFAAGVRKLRDSLLNTEPPVPPGSTGQYQGKADLQVFLRTGKRHTLMLRGQAGYIDNGRVLLSEMYRIGGFQTLRGSDEESLYATGFAIGTLEWRYVFGEYSRLFAFYDQAWYEQKVGGEGFNDNPAGLGMGISFDSGGGIFSISYAMGRAFEESFSLRQSRVHFGFSSLF